MHTSHAKPVNIFYVFLMCINFLTTALTNILEFSLQSFCFFFITIFPGCLFLRFWIKRGYDPRKDHESRVWILSLSINIHLKWMVCDMVKKNSHFMYLQNQTRTEKFVESLPFLHPVCRCMLNLLTSIFLFGTTFTSNSFVYFFIRFQRMESGFHLN